MNCFDRETLFYAINRINRLGEFRDSQELPFYLLPVRLDGFLFFLKVTRWGIHIFDCDMEHLYAVNYDLFLDLNG